MNRLQPAKGAPVFVEHSLICMAGLLTAFITGNPCLGGKKLLGISTGRGVAAVKGLASS